MAASSEKLLEAPAVLSREGGATAAGECWLRGLMGAGGIGDRCGRRFTPDLRAQLALPDMQVTAMGFRRERMSAVDDSEIGSATPDQMFKLIEREFRKP
jgi:hypothetical protein